MVDQDRESRPQYQVRVMQVDAQHGGRGLDGPPSRTMRTGPAGLVITTVPKLEPCQVRAMAATSTLERSTS